MVRVGLTCGTFDYIIHEGHIAFLNACNEVCEELWVAVVSDEIVIENKGRRPYYPQTTRVANLRRLPQVYIPYALESGVTPMRLHNLIQPDIYILGIDQQTNPYTIQAVNYAYMNKVPSIVIMSPRTTSTTDLLRRDGLLHTLSVMST